MFAEDLWDRSTSTFNVAVPTTFSGTCPGMYLINWTSALILLPPGSIIHRTGPTVELFGMGFAMYLEKLHFTTCSRLISNP